MAGALPSRALTASALNHPNICTIYDSGECGGRPFLSMELVEGRTLAELVKNRPPVDELARLTGQAARALAAAHAAGVVHRDIKPQNLMVRPTASSRSSTSAWPADCPPTVPRAARRARTLAPGLER